MGLHGNAHVLTVYSANDIPALSSVKLHRHLSTKFVLPVL